MIERGDSVICLPLFFGSDSTWWWWCPACDDGVKTRYRPRGPMPRSDARYAAKQHKLMRDRHRAGRAAAAAWKAEILATSDPVRFRALVVERFPRLDREDYRPDVDRMMLVQAGLRMGLELP